MKKFQPPCHDRNWTRVTKETRAYCLDKQSMSNSDTFVSVAGIDRIQCSHGKIFIPPTEIFHFIFILKFFIQGKMSTIIKLSNNNINNNKNVEKGALRQNSDNKLGSYRVLDSH